MQRDATSIKWDSLELSRNIRWMKVSSDLSGLLRIGTIISSLVYTFTFYNVRHESLVYLHCSGGFPCSLVFQCLFMFQVVGKVFAQGDPPRGSDLGMHLWIFAAFGVLIEEGPKPNQNYRVYKCMETTKICFSTCWCMYWCWFHAGSLVRHVLFTWKLYKRMKNRLKIQ